MSPSLPPPKKKKKKNQSWRTITTNLSEWRSLDSSLVLPLSSKVLFYGHCPVTFSPPPPHPIPQINGALKWLAPLPDSCWCWQCSVGHGFSIPTARDLCPHQYPSGDNSAFSKRNELSQTLQGYFKQAYTRCAEWRCAWPVIQSAADTVWLCRPLIGDGWSTAHFAYVSNGTF